MTDIDALAGRTTRIRELILRMLCSAEAGHTGGSLSLVEIVTVLYFHAMKIDPQDPQWEDRDRFILSKGHSSAGLYAILAERGYFPHEKLEEFDQLDGMLQGHPDMRRTPGIDMSTGSLGQGLSAGIGMAVGGRAMGKSFHTYVLLGDGELQEGQVWEAAMWAGANRVKRLVAIVDRNKLQSTGRLTETLDIEPLADKWRAFNWQVLECDGHDVGELIKTVDQAKVISESSPVVIIAHTNKGQGVSFICDNAEWHAKAPNEDELRRALEELSMGVAR